jgi:carbonic anhydrase
VRQRHAAEPDRHPRGHQGAARPGAFDYKPSAFRVIDNGHTVQVNVAPGNSIEVMGRRYELVQFHFHRPSEERIDGRQFDMVVHLVHKDPKAAWPWWRCCWSAAAPSRWCRRSGTTCRWRRARKCRRATRSTSGAAAGRAQLLHLHGLAHHAAVQRGRAVDGDEAAGGLSPEQIGIFARLYR